MNNLRGFDVDREDAKLHWHHFQEHADSLAPLLQHLKSCADQRAESLQALLVASASVSDSLQGLAKLPVTTSSVVLSALEQFVAIDG